MCGRFGLSRDERELAGEFSDLNPKFEISEIAPRYNIAPTQPVLTLRVDEDEVWLGLLRWGISTPPAHDGRRRDLINVRAETALRGGLFHELLKRGRALVPASHFYEWRTLGGRRRQPMLIGPAQGNGLVLAGLLGSWTDDRTGQVVPAVTILTTEPNELLSEIHNRMPVILPRASWGRWLDPDADAGDVADLLAPCPDEWLMVRPIGTLVNNVANEGPDLIEPPEPERVREVGQLELWPRIVCLHCGERHERRRQVGQIECRAGAVYNALTGDPVDLLSELEHQAAALSVPTALRPRRREFVLEEGEGPRGFDRRPRGRGRRFAFLISNVSASGLFAPPQIPSACGGDC